MHHHTENEEKAFNLWILAVSGPGECFTCCGVCYHLFLVWQWVPFSLVHFSFVAYGSFRVGAPHHQSWATVARAADRTHHRNPRRPQRSFCVDFENDTEVVDSEQDHLQHGAGFRSTPGWKDTARCGGSGSETAEVCPRWQDQPSQSSAVPGNIATQPLVKCHHGLSGRRIRSQWARQLPPATVVHARGAQATYRR